MNLRQCFVAACLSYLIAGPHALGDDWPQWRGPNRDDVQAESGLMAAWPEGGPELLWRNNECGLGYAGFSVVGDRLFTMGLEQGKQFVICLNAVDGTEIWRTNVGGNYKNNWGDGPRSTPTVDGDHVFALAADGALICVKATDGQEVWTVALTDFGGKVPGWGYCESVLVDGNQVVCTPGGSQGTILALNRTNGEKIWQTDAFTQEAHYSSIVPATINGKKQYVQLTMGAVVGVDPENGSVIWQADWPGKVAVIPTPIVHNDHVYVSSGYAVGSGLFQIDGSNAKSVWFNKVMKNHHGGVIRIGEHLYGFSDDAGWVCQDWNSGERVWADESKLGKGAIAFAGDRLYCVGEADGQVVLIEASPEGWKEHGRFTLSPQTERRSARGAIWVHPVIANGRLYLRDQEIVYCYDVSEM